MHQDVICDAKVALIQGAVLSLQVDGAVQLVVMEEVDGGSPKGVRGGVGNMNDAHDVARHRGVDPVDKALVDHGPIGVCTLSTGGSGGDVRVETELADD